MKTTKATYRPVSRNDLSNPFHRVSHKEQLKRANVTDLRNNFVIQDLPDGRIIAKPIDKDKKYK